MQYFEEKCKIVHFRSLTLISENTPKIISVGPPIMEKRPFKKLKILAFWHLLFQKQKELTFSVFHQSNIFGKQYSFLKIWHIWVNHCWNYGPPNLLFCFTRLVTSVGKFSSYRCLRFESYHRNQTRYFPSVRLSERIHSWFKLW